MQAIIFLHKLILKSFSPHARRLDCLLTAARSALEGRRLTVTGLGRNINDNTTTRSSIGKMDRLLNNGHLYGERIRYYAVSSSLFLRGKVQPLISVDLSEMPDLKHYVIRAAVACEGRSFPIYEEVHTRKEAMSIRMQKRFLDRLKRDIVPKHCKPIIISDAGFKGPWFKEVSKIGWDWVGRVRGNTNIEIEGVWVSVNELFAQATEHGKAMGKDVLGKEQQLSCSLFITKERSKGRKKLTKHGKAARSGRSKTAAKGQKEPWVLVSSLPADVKYKSTVIKAYKTRMQIEEGFRDLKSHKTGLGLEGSKTKIGYRF